MNKRQKLVQQQFLNNEEAVIKRLDKVYSKSLSDVNDKIKNLEFTINNLQQVYDWMDDNDPEREKVKSMIQSKIYQKQYQEQLQTQLDGILNQMQTQSYLTVSDYLDGCYEDGFIGTIFDAHGQGVPVMTPINQESMVRAVQLDSKISQGLYTRLGEDVDLLKRKIVAQVSRSIATGETFAQTAKQLENYTRIGYNNAIRITRTEGHRIQTTATMDAMKAARNMGADVVKQWDSTLDARTRESHADIDGEIRELNDPFSNGLMFPGDPSGKASEVVNCRCALLQRASWALKETIDPDTSEVIYTDDGFSKFDRNSNEIKEFAGIDDYNEFKKKYLNVVNAPEPVTSQVNLVSLRSELKSITSDITNTHGEISKLRRSLFYGADKDSVNAQINDLQNKLTTLESQVVTKGKVLVENMNTTFKVSTDNEKFISMIVQLDSRIDYNEVMTLTSDRTIDEIVKVLGGGDTTSGSCASVGLGYIGQRNGWDVLDFRGGDSMDWFSSKAAKLNMWDALGVNYITEDSAKSNITNGKRILSKLEKGKEYYLSVGRHASIVRKNDDGVVQYLELQSATKSGWTDFNGNIGYTLKDRFGCSSNSNYYATAYLTDIDDLKDSAEFRTILGYINTSESAQRKGVYGTIK